ncbi:hypothetical protein BT69DRAFT_807190 [Atractiella rhizophila]|nr:hypothetical protein BT69DRAFT_807190 [Atractiella rhizophila]
MALNIRVAVLIRSLVKEWASPLARARKGEEGRKLKSFWQGVIDTRLDVESVREGWENVHGKGAISKEKKKDGRAYFLSFEAQIARAIFIAHKVLEDRIASQREEIMGGRDRRRANDGSPFQMEGIEDFTLTLNGGREVEKDDLEELKRYSDQLVRDQLTRFLKIIVSTLKDPASNKLPRILPLRHIFLSLSHLPDMRTALVDALNTIEDVPRQDVLTGLKCLGYSYGDINAFIMELNKRLAEPQPPPQPVFAQPTNPFTPVFPSQPYPEVPPGMGASVAFSPSEEEVDRFIKSLSQSTTSQAQMQNDMFSNLSFSLTPQTQPLPSPSTSNPSFDTILNNLSTYFFPLPANPPQPLQPDSQPQTSSDPFSMLTAEQQFFLQQHFRSASSNQNAALTRPAPSSTSDIQNQTPPWLSGQNLSFPLQQGQQPFYDPRSGRQGQNTNTALGGLGGGY